MPEARKLPPGWPYPRVFAHRGGGRLAPENTLAALRVGHARGFGGVEFDVMLSADGEPVLIHDETLERTTNGTGMVSRQTLRELDRLDAGGWFGACFIGERIPRFAAAARLCIELGLLANVEIKPATGAGPATGKVVAAAAAACWQDAAVPPLLSSFDETALAAARAAAPHLPRALLVEAIPPDWQARLQALDCGGLHCGAAGLTATLAGAVREAGYALAVWTVNDRAEALRLFGWGVTAIFTDRLDLIPPDLAAPAQAR